MKLNEIKAAIVRKGLSQIEVAEAVGINIHSFRKKINGDVEFSSQEKAKLADVLELTQQQVADWLCDEGTLALCEKLTGAPLFSR